MRPPNKKSNFQVIKEETIALFPQFSSNDLDKLLNFQWAEAFRQFSQEGVSSVEITGFGTFRVKPKQAKKELQNKEDALFRYNKKIEEGTGFATLPERRELLIKDIELLKGKIKRAEENLERSKQKPKDNE